MNDFDLHGSYIFHLYNGPIYGYVNFLEVDFMTFMQKYTFYSDPKMFFGMRDGEHEDAYSRIRSFLHKRSIGDFHYRRIDSAGIDEITIEFSTLGCAVLFFKEQEMIDVLKLIIVDYRELRKREFAVRKGIEAAG